MPLFLPLDNNAFEELDEARGGLLVVVITASPPPDDKEEEEVAGFFRVGLRPGPPKALIRALRASPRIRPVAVVACI